MNAHRWQKLEEIFHQALEQPTAQDRDAWLEGACAGDTELRAEVLSLIASDHAAAGGFVGSKVEHAVLELHKDELQPVHQTMEGRQIGPYRLIRELGRGGMGAVYLAARDDQQYESEVAIKLVRPGLDTDFVLRRFRRERQILAHLQHPNIARLFDGGTSEDGTPYLVMEYVQGSWITKYAAQENLNIEDRLRLFLPVCAAVEYAHRNFIVHRDLKPGNILIDHSGAPKLLDFGVSKLLHANQHDPGDTQGVGMLTPDYASPEQILGERVTTASDVYSLGAVLYELLSGARPHRIDQCSSLALERAICLDETVAPSAASINATVSERLVGDLDNIILRAMQKQPERRYSSAEQMGEDIRRHLDHRPIIARPDSLGYRAHKFIRRNRLAVALAALLVASFIGGGAVALRQARIAHERFDQVRKLATSFVFDVEEAARELPGARPVRQLIARTGLEYLDNLSRSSAKDWELKRELAAAYMRIGQVQGGAVTSNLGDTAGALKSFHGAQTLLDDVLIHDRGARQARLDRMTVAHYISNLHRQTGQLPLAIEANEDGLRRAEALLANTPGDADAIQYSAVFHMDLARLRQESGELARAAEEIERALVLLRELAAARPGERETLGNIAVSHPRLGAIKAELGRRQEALDNYRAGLAACEELNRRFPNDVHARRQLMFAYNHVGDTLGNPVYDNFGDVPGALAAYGKMVGIAKTLHEADLADVRATSDYGIALLRLGIVTRDGRKRATLEKAYQLLEIAARRSPKDKPTLSHKAWAELELGDALLAGGNRTAALRYYQQAIASAEHVQILDPKDSSSQRWLIFAAQKLAEDQVRSGDRTATLATLNTLLQLGDRVDRQAPPTSVVMRSIVARTWQAAGSVYAALARRASSVQAKKDREAAGQWYRRSITEWRKLEPLQGFTAPLRKEMLLALAGQTALGTSSLGTQ
jgi:eukaryotic-like serine/threonine-protein kinase